MREPARRKLALKLYEESGSLDAVAEHIAGLNGNIHYSPRHVAYDLWRAVGWKRVNQRRSKRQWAIQFDVVDGRNVESPATFREFHLQAIADAFLDLEAGMPCTMGLRGLAKYWRRCHEELYWGDKHLPEWHYCAQDALAWLTSTDFYRVCESLEWPWRDLMEQVLLEAQTTTAIFPWLVLTPAMVWRIACVLQGEAGVLGAKGMWYVGDTMLSRRARGDSWEEVLSAYYGYEEPPGETAMQVADKMLYDPWEPSGRVFAYERVAGKFRKIRG